MANPNIEIGFIPTPILQTNRYVRDAASSTAIFMGDVVQMDDDGNINAATAGNTGLIGASLTFATGSAAATNIIVADNISQIFHAQDDGDTDTAAQTDIGLNANHVATAGQMALKRGRHEIDIDSATTAAAGFGLLEFVQNVEYTIGANSIFKVICKEHLHNTGTGV